MNISAPFVRRPIGTSLLAMGLLLFGGTAYFFLPIAPLPQVDFPTIGVSASLPGVDPATAASAMAAPLERRLGQIPAVTEMTSSSSLGNANVTVQFDLDRDVDDAARDVQAAINASLRDLPVGLPNPPGYRKYNPSDSPVIILAMTSKSMRLSEVYNLADQIVAQRLLQMPGVSQVGIYGGAKTAVRVQVNPASLASMGLSMEDVRTFLQSANRLLPKGSLQTSDGRTFMVSANDQLFGADKYRELVIAERNGVPIRLGDIATVIDSNENVRQAGWFNRERAVLLPVMKQSDANVIAVVDQIKKILPQLQSWVPPGVKISVMSDRTQTIRASVHDVQFTLILTVGLVTLVMGIFLRRFWPTFIAGVTVPLALAGTFGVMWLCGFSLDNISLMALTVAVGFLVDDAIVVIENIVRHLEQGDEPLRAALEGARQISFTVISMSLSLIAVFLPILLMGGLVGRLFHEFAVTLSSAIIVSAIVSLTLTPTLCGKFLKRQVDHSPPRWDVSGLLQRYYARGLQWVLRSWTFVLAVWFGTLVLTIWLYTVVPKGFFPQQDTGLLIGTTDAAQDVSFAVMEQKQLQLVDILLKDPSIVTIGSFVGGGGGSSTNNGRMFITLKPADQRPPVDQVIAELRHKTSKIPGITLYLNPVQDIRVGGRAGKAQYQYTLRDANLQELNDWAPKLLEKLKKVPGLEDVNTDQQFQGLQTNVVIDRDAAGRLGIQPEVIDSTLYSAFGQRQVSIMYGEKNQYRVILEADPDFQQDANALNKIFVTAPGGKSIPLSAIAHYERVNVPLSVNHQGQFAAVTISFNLSPGVTLDDATTTIEQAVRELHMPDTVSGGFAGNAKAFKDSAGNQLILYLAALLAVYIVLGMLYESLIHPITILSTLPGAGLGALLALLFTNMDLSIVASIGIILLIGIVKKNAIMMVDFALESQRDRGCTAEEAIYEACLVRFRPIMMTTLAALFGSLPLAIGMGVGSELRRPLGIAIVGGLIVSQTLTLFTTPVVYLFMEKLRAFVHRLRPKKKRIVAPARTSVA